MNFTEPLIVQYDKFFTFIGFGFLTGFVYDFAVFIRELISSKKAAWIIQDVLFSIAATISMYLMFLAYANGEIRLILIFSTAVGFAVYKFTVGKPIQKCFSKIGKAIHLFMIILFKPFQAAIAFIETQIQKMKTKIKTFRTAKRRKAKEKTDAENPKNKKEKKIVFKKFTFKFKNKFKKDLKKEKESV